MKSSTPPTTEDLKGLLEILKKRFDQNTDRHPHLKWYSIEGFLLKHLQLLIPVYAMELTGGYPDIIHTNPSEHVLHFYDCSPESPVGRRSLCYDKEALESRKANKPTNSAVALALDMGVTLLNEEQYHYLQQFGPFDCKTSSWISTPHDIRSRGGGLFGDWRFGRVFIYHNGAESYYGARGFRAVYSIDMTA